MRLAHELLEPRAMLANAAPVAVNDTYFFDGAVQRNVAAGIEPVTYIEAGSTWFYSDDGSDQRTLNPEWNAGPEAGFDPVSGNEPGWAASGAAPLGFGDPVSTTLRSGHSAYYFYRPFNVDPVPEALFLGVQVDDCAAIYINGLEVHRTANFGSGPISHDRLCATGTPSETTFFESFIDTAALNLQPSGNTIAVEVHQVSLQSSDVRFDLRLQSGGLGLLANDYDPDGARDALTVEVVSTGQASTYGTLDVSPDGTVAFMPRSHTTNGQFSFTYRVVDAGDPPQVSNVATATVRIQGCDCFPVLAYDDIGIPQFIIHEDQVLVIDASSGPVGSAGVGVLANDTTFYWSPVTARVVSQPTSGGTVVFSLDGGFTYAPGKDFAGIDSFQYVANDGFNDSNAATVDIVVLPVDDPPVAIVDRYSVVAGGTLNASGLGLIPRGATWNYLDELEATEPYPLDGAENAWNAAAFDAATSDPAIGAWKTARAPFELGEVRGFEFAGAAVTNLAGSAYTHHTYLFRRTFELAAGTAAGISALAAEFLADDAAVFYINGIEVGRYNFAADVGTLTPASRNGPGGANGVAGNEASYSSQILPVGPGVLHDGVNTIAVELHQNSNTSSDAGFDMSLSVAPGAGVLFNDFDVEGDAIFGAAVVPGSGPLGTLVEFRPDGTFVYVPPPGFVGVDTFEYTASTAGGTSQPGTVTIRVESDLRLDLNGDTVVDLGDLSILVGHFGTAAGANNAVGDVDFDGRVSLTDAIQLRNGMTTGPAEASAAAAVVAKRLEASPAAVDRAFERLDVRTVARARRGAGASESLLGAELSVAAGAGDGQRLLAAGRLREAAGRRLGRG